MMVWLITQVRWNIKSSSEISQYQILLKHFPFRNWNFHLEITPYSTWGECSGFLKLLHLVPGVGRSLFHQKIIPWLWLKALRSRFVWELHLSSSCVVFARYLTPYLTPVSTLAPLKWDYYLAEQTLWGATGLVAVSILWEVLVLYSTPRLCCGTSPPMEALNAVYSYTARGSWAVLKNWSQKHYTHYIQSIKTL